MIELKITRYSQIIGLGHVASIESEQSVLDLIKAKKMRANTTIKATQPKWKNISNQGAEDKKAVRKSGNSNFQNDTKLLGQLTQRRLGTSAI